MANLTRRGNSYRIRVSCGYDAKGRQRFASKTWPIPERLQGDDKADKARKEAEKAAVLFEAEYKGGSESASIKFDAFIDEYFRDFAPIKLKQLSQKSYRGLSVRVRKELGHLRLDKIAKRDVQRMVTNLKTAKRADGRSGNLSGSAIREHVMFASSVFEYAISLNMVDRNPCHNIITPEHIPKEREIFTLEEARLFMSKLFDVRGEKFPLAVALILDVYTGFRRGEILGLEWADFTPDFEIVSVRRAAYRTKELKHFTDSVKTKSSMRTLKLPSEVSGLLAEYKRWQEEYAFSLGDKWLGADRLFTAWDGSPMYVNAPYKYLQKFCDDIGVKRVCLHSLRHLNASLMIVAGKNAYEVQKSLGHNSMATTEKIYIHEFAEAKARADAGEAVGNALRLNRG